MSHQSDYEAYAQRLNTIVYESLVLKIGCYQYFNETLHSADRNVLEAFPLMPILTEALHIDIVITLSKLLENNKNGWDFIRFINFVSSNRKKLLWRGEEIPLKIIKEHDKQLDNCKAMREKLFKQRDKYFAHSDKQYFLEPNLIVKDFPDSYREILQLVGVIQSIISDHMNGINGERSVSLHGVAYVGASQMIEFLCQASESFKKKYRQSSS
ncbi:MULTISPECIES: hypothetical protein [Nostocales]|jgi:hypothetical protein|uniref:Uncharacterized protein n=1 Tax=Dolichospermum flos-aquae UHCC 0037 TaxID=2590026 RepID=A0ACC7SBL7_DOLFA|nr:MULTISPECIES: hypothetical protein [Nostocales]MBO1063241.1 hypothetical protein [Anabaena sp. 54]MTJ45567.1 hypothetical protein [Dolichospermum flos-aquae UHCC 0037]